MCLDLPSPEFIVLGSLTLTPEFVYLPARSDISHDVSITNMSAPTKRMCVPKQYPTHFQIEQPSRTLLGRFSAIVVPNCRFIYWVHLNIQDLRDTCHMLLPGQVALKQS